MDWESQDDGFIAKILVEDGAKDISVGEPVLVFVEEEVPTPPFPYHQHCMTPERCMSPCWLPF